MQQIHTENISILADCVFCTIPFASSRVRNASAMFFCLCSSKGAVCYVRVRAVNATCKSAVRVGHKLIQHRYTYLCAVSLTDSCKL